jgi:hypothetical protein
MVISPLGSDVVVMTRGAGVMVSGSVTVWVSAGALASVTLKVSETAFTDAVGVPVIAPVPAFSVKPAGSVPLVCDQV